MSHICATHANHDFVDSRLQDSEVAMDSRELPHSVPGDRDSIANFQGPPTAEFTLLNDDTRLSGFIIPALGSTENQTRFLQVQVHEHSGRSYHAICAIPADTTILKADTPYTYTIWKPFRNEVCAECWRYDGGRRNFLTRRDDEGVFEDLVYRIQGTGGHHRKSSVGAGLWFCDSTCQERWLQREGTETMDLLRSLEEARRQKEVEKDKDGGFRLEDLGCTELTREGIDRAWGMIAQKERSPKEVRKWKNLQLSHFETDIARYALIALAHRHRENLAEEDERSRYGDLAANTSHNGTRTGPALRFGGAGWEDFVALQSNELRHLKSYPELLENQIRAYQALKGRFCNPNPAGPSPSEPSRQSRTQTNSEHSPQDAPVHPNHVPQTMRTGREESANGPREAVISFGSMITIENVRRTFGVDPGNSFGIWEAPVTDESELMGFAVYPKPSFFNHHCAPNVTKVRKGRGLEFVTTRQVEPGEELCISYGHVEGMSLEERQKELREGWFFECRCSRCMSEAEASGKVAG